jgi:hypothetical protein
VSFLDLYQGDQQQAATIQPNEGHDLPSGFTENLRASWADGQMFSQSIARSNARAAVLGDYLDEIRQKTGNDLSKEFIPDVAGGGQTGVTDFDTANERVARLKAQYPELDLDPLSEDEIEKRAVAKAQSAHRTYETLQAGEKTWGGSFGSFLGGAGSAAADPINILALGVAPETGGIGIVSSALRWGALAGVSQAAIEASSGSFKEEVQPGYTESGAPLADIGGAFVGGAVLGGTTKALGNLWSRVKTGQWPTSVRDAGNVIESEAHVADSNPFPGAEGEVAHREALVKTIEDILANRPVQIDHIITPDFLGRSRALVERLQTEQPMALPIINQRAFELIAEQDRLTKRDAELASSLESMPAGDASAADRLNRLQAVEQQIAEVTNPAAKRALNERRDQILVDTNPEKLQAAAAPIEARRAAEAERASIADRLEQITQEHANLQASTLPEMQLPALGQSERIPGGPAQMELPFETAPEPKPATDPGPQPAMQTADQMRKTLTSPEHQDVIRGDIDRAIDENAAAGNSDIMVPGIDENGNHTMVSVHSAVDEVDAYKKLADDIQACATMQEAAE